MTLTEILEHEKIRSDRYALAAISHIYKAFGDQIRSKECWPWGRDVQCEWYPSKGVDMDITEAELLLERARTKYEEENNSGATYSKLSSETMENYDKEIKNLRKRLMRFSKKINNVNTNNENIIKISQEVESKIS